MKKIISALTLGAMVAGAAFADVSINLNFRQRANLFTKYDSDTKYALNTDAYSGSGSDNLAMSLSGDIVSFDMQWVTDQSATAKWRAKGLNASVFLGPVTVFGGLWADGKLNGAYRTKADIDAGNLEGMDFEYVKLGSAYKTAPDNFFDNMVQDVSGNMENYSVGASYKVPGIDNGALTLNAVYISNEGSKTTNKANTAPTTLSNHTGVFLADGRIDGIGQGEVSFKYGDWQKSKIDKETKQAMSFGVALQPTLVKNLINTFVFSGSMIDNKFNDYAINLRLRYQAIPKKLSITSFHNYSAIVDADKIATERTGMTAETAKGLADSKVATDMKLGGTAIKADAVMSNNLMVRYNVNGKFSVYGIVADMMSMSDKALGKDTDKVTQLRCSAWTQFYADANNSVAVGFVYAINDLSDNTSAGKYTTMGVPVIFRVKM